MLKQTILNAIVNKQSIEQGSLKIEYLTAINNPMQARLEQCKIFYNDIYIVNYIYLSHECISVSTKTIFYFPENYFGLQQKEIKEILQVFHLYLD